MKLTDKCEIAFNEYCKNKGLENFNNKKYALVVCKSFWNTLFIDFFDSVGIYIEIRVKNNNPLHKGFHSYVIKSINGYYRCTTIPLKTRQEAIEKAIEKADEIYNSK